MTREGNSLILDDSGRLTNAFLPLSDTSFVAEDADRGFVITREPKGDVSGLMLRLVGDRMPAQRIGPLVGAVKREPDADPPLTTRIESVLKAFSQGGKAVEEVVGVAPQARKDFAPDRRWNLQGCRRSTTSPRETYLTAGSCDTMQRWSEYSTFSFSRKIRLVTYWST